MSRFKSAGGGLRPLLSGLLAAGLVTLTITVAVALGMQEQEMVAAVEPTATRVLPSPMMTATSAPVPSPTYELPTVLPTMVPMEQATETGTPSPVPMPSATARATSRPRVYASATSRPVYVAPIVTCRKRTTWPIYVIQSGDTLYGIAGRINSSVSVLMQANCLTSEFIPAGGILYVPRLPAKPTAPAPKISRFTIEPSGQVLVGLCVQVRWSVTGSVSGLTLQANSTVLWRGTKLTWNQQHCLTVPGKVIYRLTATGPGGTTYDSRAITAYVPGTVAPTETNTQVPVPTNTTSVPGEPTAVPTTVTAVSPEPTTATPTDTSSPPSSTPVAPTSTSVPLPTATSAPPPTATSAPPPTATSAPPPTATSAPPPTATSAPPPTATSAPPPTATSVPSPSAPSEAKRLPELTGLPRAS